MPRFLTRVDSEAIALFGSQSFSNAIYKKEAGVAPRNYPYGMTKSDREYEFQEMLRRIDRDATALKIARSPQIGPAFLQTPGKPARIDEPLVSLTNNNDEDKFELLPSFAEALTKP